MNENNVKKKLLVFFASALIVFGSIATCTSVVTADTPTISNPSPSDGATGISTDVTLSVYISSDETVGVTFYDASDDSVIGTNDAPSGGYTVPTTWSGLSAGTTYNWYVTADDGTENVTSSTWSFTTVSPPSNPSPSDNAKIQETTSTTVSVDVSDPEGDNMDVTFWNSDNGNVVGANTGVTNGTTSVTWSGLTPANTYNWYATSDDGDNNVTSSTWSFTVNRQPSVSNPSPSDGATSTDLSPTLSVDISDTEATTVTFYNNSNDNVIGANDVPAGGSAETTWSGLTVETTYSWYVTADDGTDNVTSSTWSFTTTYSNDPPSIYNPSPSDGATNITTDPILKVDVSDPEDESVRVTFFNNSDDSMLGQQDVIGSGTLQTEWGGGLARGYTYSWYVTADDGTHNVTSSTWSFTTTSGYAPSISNPSPPDDTTYISTPVTLSVDVSDADGDSMNVTFYEVEHYSPEDSKIGEKLGVGNGTVSVTWSGLSYDSYYYWYVEAVDEGGTTSISSTWSFFTSSNTQPTVSNPEPDDGATGISLSRTISVAVSDEEGDEMNITFWNATHETEIGSNTYISNGTTSVTWSGLKYGTTYDWFVVVDDINADSDDTSTPLTSGVISSTWSFTTVSAPDDTTNERLSVSDPSPEDNSSVYRENITLEITVINDDGGECTITFYNASSGSVIGVDVANDGEVASTSWTNLSFNSTYEWHVTIDNGSTNLTSAVYSFEVEENSIMGSMSELTSFLLKLFPVFIIFFLLKMVVGAFGSVGSEIGK